MKVGHDMGSVSDKGNVSVEELKAFLDCKTDTELAMQLDRGVSSVSNWRKTGVPPLIMNRANKIKGVGVVNGDNNTVHVGGNHMPPETQLIQNLLAQWPDSKRKKLLMLALQLDCEEKAK
jgi:hypothetical protein